MSPELTYTLLGAIIPAIGWVGRESWKSLKEAREGTKADADRIADERDRYGSMKSLWRNRYDELRADVLALGLTRDQLDQIPPYPDDKYVLEAHTFQATHCGGFMHGRSTSW